MTLKRYTTKSDVYSFGVLLWEIYSSGDTPYKHICGDDVVRMVLAGEKLQRPTPLTPDTIVKLIRSCTALPATGRPAMRAVHAQLVGRCAPQGFAPNHAWSLRDSWEEDAANQEEESVL